MRKMRQDEIDLINKIRGRGKVLTFDEVEQARVDMSQAIPERIVSPRCKCTLVPMEIINEPVHREPSQTLPVPVQELPQEETMAQMPNDTPVSRGGFSEREFLGVLDHIEQALGVEFDSEIDVSSPDEVEHWVNISKVMEYCRALISSKPNADNAEDGKGTPGGVKPGQYMHEWIEEDAVNLDLPSEEIIIHLCQDNALLKRKLEEAEPNADNEERVNLDELLFRCEHCGEVLIPKVDEMNDEEILVEPCDCILDEFKPTPDDPSEAERKKGGRMNPIKRFLCHRITDLTEDLLCSKAERDFLDGFNAGRKSWRYAALGLHISFAELKIEILKALGGV